MPDIEGGPAVDTPGADEYVITYLEMTERPGPPPHPPIGMQLALIGAEDPPESWFVYLYRAVGDAYQWTDWLEATPAQRSAFLSDPEVDLYTLMLNGWPGGFFMLDTRERGVCDLAYFGLVPEAVGRGLGRWFLGNALQMAWDRPGVERVTVNTCTLDHPRALPNYQKAGFVPIRRETHTRLSSS